ncbi:Ig-like domain-containing protein [Piscinibacter sakaiensis]|uniref:Ig-like domain-containing protein n=1 Tax=Piscinibacter sakaiensis TaxID=1547922 RepID=UPI003AAD4E4D
MRWIRYRSKAVAAMLAAALVGCGGGVTIGFGSGDFFDDGPPSVSMVASSGTVAPGQSVLLTAAAADANGIDVVAFYRLDPGVQFPLGTIARPPYQLSITAPADGRSVLRVFARAIDNVGNRADSTVVEIAIR